MILIVLNIDLEFLIVEENSLVSKFILKREFDDKRLKPLNLSDKFNRIWEKAISTNLDNILFVLGEKASFTDTRVVWMWLKSNKYFNEVDFYFYKSSYIDIDRENAKINNKSLNAMLKISHKNPHSINYLKEPNIG